MPPAAAKTDLERAYEALKVKQETYTALLDYYDGDQPIRYVSQRLADVFQIDGARFTENWTAVVVDSELERIRLREFDIADAAAPTAAPPSEGETLPENPAQARLNDLFAETELNLDAEDVHKVTLVTGEAFICAWKDEETGEIEAYYNDPRLCHVFYDPAHPRK
jgi:hypothetical protein